MVSTIGLIVVMVVFLVLFGLYLGPFLFLIFGLLIMFIWGAMLIYGGRIR